MKFIFWGATLLISYTYFGYPAWLWILSRWRTRSVRSGSYLPYISIVLVVRNEAARIGRKLDNLAQLAYPSDQVEIVALSDGSSDQTNLILSEYAKSGRIRSILNQQAQGKAAGLNDAMKVAEGEIVVFTDARQQLERDSVRLLMKNFADPDVGCASGELMLGNSDEGESKRGMGLYWKIEKTIREMESASGSVVGATGAFYAVRRSLLWPIPPQTILDDVLIPMQVLRQGRRVVFDSRARAWDLPDLGMKREFTRKVRTLSGNYQLLRLAPWLLTKDNPIRFSFVSHKLLRLIVPFALIAALVSAAALPGLIFRIALFAQIIFYGIAASALARPRNNWLAKAANAASTFVILNAAALAAFMNFISGRKPMWLQ